ncbi:hypothetical protein SYJ56_22665 [Algoriphagus sp. D3-2-R+10]|uniref:hypothetical protein n=1 Tax=Algoriphagus aurantiacus TaxID=3103948 RepID=UPI002B3BE447|nr:hypothetical protein [Algoriphagus sp. D3-2-R+10]MEB2778132.1 hypothetical protein [Algoriphagus sp. D3-2-R+10]
MDNYKLNFHIRIFFALIGFIVFSCNRSKDLPKEFLFDQNLVFTEKDDFNEISFPKFYTYNSNLIIFKPGDSRILVFNHLGELVFEKSYTSFSTSNGLRTRKNICLFSFQNKDILYLFFNHEILEFSLSDFSETKSCLLPPAFFMHNTKISFLENEELLIGHNDLQENAFKIYNFNFRRCEQFIQDSVKSLDLIDKYFLLTKNDSYAILDARTGELKFNNIIGSENFSIKLELKNVFSKDSLDVQSQSMEIRDYPSNKIDRIFLNDQQIYVVFKIFNNVDRSSLFKFRYFVSAFDFSGSLLNSGFIDPSIVGFDQNNRPFKFHDFSGKKKFKFYNINQVF